MQEKYWIARDRNGELWLYNDKPEINEEDGTYRPVNDFYLKINIVLFGSLTYEDGPKQIGVLNI